MTDRRCLAAVLALVVPIAAIGAPFVHAHPDDHHDGHHRGARVHAHLDQHTTSDSRHGSEPALGDDDFERTLTLQLFVAVSPGAAAVPGLPAARFTFTPAATPSPRPVWQVAHGHDPPLLGSLSPRAPPAARLS